jgi:alkanesulfonate monooxygenase SsuD/methylene tetrahydromethanopterin reductase-like flavin-dependent oxidoreductase (luciferase family)
MHFTVSNFPGMGWNERSRQVVDLARVCEEVGIERFAIEDNRFHYDCFALITACLEATERLVVECLVTDPFVRPPYLTARMAGTIADLSDGRLILGWGGGLERPAFSGETRLHPMQAVRESVEVCRRLWSGERVDMEGQVVRTLGAVFHFAPTPHIPILIAARGRGMLRLAGEIGDIAHMASVFIDTEHQRENVARVVAGARRVERRADSFEIDMSVPICVSRDRQLARRSAKRIAAQGILWMAAAEEYSRDRTDWKRPPQLTVSDDIVTAITSNWNMWKQPALPDDLAALISDDVLDQFAVAGEPEECAKRLCALAAEVPGITGMRFKLPPPTGPSAFESYREIFELLGDVLDRTA